MTMKNATDSRWKAVCTYRSEHGPVDVTFYFEEIEDLDELIERGPDWNALIDCVITLNRVTNVNLMLAFVVSAGGAEFRCRNRGAAHHLLNAFHDNDIDAHIIERTIPDGGGE